MKRTKERYFRLKPFGVHHSLSAMKVGIDAVLLGCWAQVSAESAVLDAGCGCGIISLMLAWRGGEFCRVEAIDTDPFAVIEAKQNFVESGIGERLHACRQDFMQHNGIYTHIVSNPPYFRSGVRETVSTREAARHSVSLSPLTLVEQSRRLLVDNGLLSMICPPFWLPELQETGRCVGMCIERICEVQGTPTADVSRVLVELRRCNNYTSVPEVQRERLIVEYGRGEYTDDYRRLTSAFLLNS